MNIINLNGNWTLSDRNRKINCPGTVPGCVHTDLLANKIIDDPFFRDNEFTQMWVCYEDWTYSRDFEISKELLDNKKIFLECMGLDTFAVITINGKEIAKTKNMHRRYSFDIKDVLKVGKNSISISFASAPKYCEPLAGGDGISPDFHSIQGCERTRKALYTYGWDWGPKIPSCGIWRDIFIKAYNELKTDDFRIEYSLKNGKALFDTEINAVMFCQKADYEIEIKDPQGKTINTIKGITEGNTKEHFEIQNPEIWYPTGFGKQPLYTFILKTEDETIEKKIGVRAAEWVQDKDKWGRTFYLKVNDIPIFAKGADYVPMDQFPSRVTREDYEKLLNSVRDTNMNFLRVWGGGIYEDDDFYDLCDEKGILVWQDFAYACDHTPLSDRNLYEEIVPEAEDNIKRLRHHPSLVLWCGNNEIEGCIDMWKHKNMDLVKKDYETLFYKIIKDCVQRLDPCRYYIPSSPFSDKIFTDTNCDECGDAHYWAVWHGSEPFTHYRNFFPRFMSEFGFQSLPSMETIKTFTLEKERNIYSRIMECHQKCAYGGNGKIMKYLEQTYRLPNGMKNLIYISQIMQADAIRYGVEHYRRNRNDFHCMGALFWQLNDCYPVISWASLEYGGRWKALQYMAKEFFRPVDISIEEDDRSVKLYIANDTAEDFKGTVRYQLCQTDGTVIFAGSAEGNCKALSSEMIKEIDLSEYILGEKKYEVFFSCSLNDFPEKYVFFAPAKYMELEKPNVEIKAEGDALKVRTDKPSFYTQIDIPDTEVRLEKNFILLMPDREYIIEIAENDGLTAEEIAQKAEIFSVALSC